MPEHVYSRSQFWSTLAEVGDVGQLLWPVVLFAACAAWALRTKSAWAYLGLLGALLSTCEHVMRQMQFDVPFLSLGKELQPLLGESSLLFFVLTYGRNLGLAIMSVCLLGYFFTREQQARETER